MVLRPHDEDDAVVLDAAVRSWPPCTPRCLRWSFPCWSPADDLDPTQLRADSAKKKADKKDEWTSEAFANTFIETQPTPRTVILAKADKAGLSHWLAERLLRQAESDALIIRVGEAKRGQPSSFQRAPAPSSSQEKRP